MRRRGYRFRRRAGVRRPGKRIKRVRFNRGGRRL